MDHGKNSSADMNVCARSHTGCGATMWLERDESLESAALSVENAPFYRMAILLRIPRERSIFCRKRRFLKSAEHIYHENYYYTLVYIYVNHYF